MFNGDWKYKGSRGVSTIGQFAGWSFELPIWSWCEFDPNAQQFWKFVVGGFSSGDYGFSENWMLF